MIIQTRVHKLETTDAIQLIKLDDLATTVLRYADRQFAAYHDGSGNQ